MAEETKQTETVQGVLSEISRDPEQWDRLLYTLRAHLGPTGLRLANAVEAGYPRAAGAPGAAGAPAATPAAK